VLMLPPSVKIFLCSEVTDMRRSFDRLAEMTRSVLAQDPLSGHLFVFFNRPRDRVKILFWDRSGFCLYYKRLEEGCFCPGTKTEMGAAELTLILEGLDLASVTKRKRFSMNRE
jgi:transposase